MIDSHTMGTGRRGSLSSAKAIALAGTAVLVAAIPAFVASGLAASLLPGYNEHRHALYIAMTLASWGALSLAVVALVLRAGGSTHSAIGRADVALGGISLAVLGAWVFSIYEWNIAKFGHIELDAVGPTTFYWPLVVILVVTLLPLVRGHRPAVLALAVGALAILPMDTAMAAVGALRDGSVSSWGIVVGLLYALEIAVLVIWLGIRMRKV